MHFVKINRSHNDEIIEKEYPVTYSIAALFWFSDFLGVPTDEVLEVIGDGQMTERKGLALMYSGLRAGAEAKGTRLDISFSEFQELIAYGDDGEDVSSALGALFQKDFQVTVTKMQRKLDKRSGGKKKKEAKVPSQTSKK